MTFIDPLADELPPLLVTAFPSSYSSASTRTSSRTSSTRTSTSIQPKSPRAMSLPPSPVKSPASLPTSPGSDDVRVILQLVQEENAELKARVAAMEKTLAVLAERQRETSLSQRLAAVEQSLEKVLQPAFPRHHVTPPSPQEIETLDTGVSAEPIEVDLPQAGSSPILHAMDVGSLQHSMIDDFQPVDGGISGFEHDPPDPIVSRDTSSDLSRPASPKPGEGEPESKPVAKPPSRRAFVTPRRLSAAARDNSSPYPPHKPSPPAKKQSTAKKPASSSRLSRTPTQSPSTRRKSATRTMMATKDSPSLSTLRAAVEVPAALPKKLAPSDGVKRGDGQWPPYPYGWDKYTMVLDEIQCEKCNGRVHWGCAGLAQGATVPESWFCPDCANHVERGTADLIIPASPARCIRHSCLRRRKTRTIVEEGDEERYHLEKIVGRRATARREDMSRIFQYLVLWTGYPLDECTWEPEDNLTHDNDGHCAAIADFEAQAAVERAAMRKKVVLLQEALPCFDPITGNLIDENQPQGEAATTGAAK